MTIGFPDGRTVEALLLSVDGDSVRAAVSGENDIRIFTQSHGSWKSEAGETVSVRFAWERSKRSANGQVSHFSCPKLLGMKAISRLMHSAIPECAEETPLYVFSSERRKVHITVLHDSLRPAS
jgi:hypothetical protein